jgi:CelD/BcsL family acetyltransferase involved in cellulose biosynthesis
MHGGDRGAAAAEGTGGYMPRDGSGGGVQVEKVETPEALAALEQEWNALASVHGEGLPFRTWEWNVAWWRWFRERSFGVRDSLFFRAFRSADGRLVGVAPLILVRRPGYGVAVVRGLEFVGTDPYVTEVRGLICEEAWRPQVYRALAEHLEACSGSWDWIRWRGLPPDGEGGLPPSARRGMQPICEVPAYYLNLPGSWEEFKASRPRNLKESLRKCYNSLKRDGHAFELVTARSPEEVAPAVEQFLALHKARAVAAGLKPHGNVFCDAVSRGFLHEVCGRLAARDAVRIFQLRIGTQVVATRIGFAVGDTLYLYFSGYDPAWAAYGVMTTTVAESIRYAIGQGFARVHLSTGTDESKLRWRPECTIYRDAEQYVSGLRAASLRWIAGASGSDLAVPVMRFARAVMGRRRQVVG